MKTITFKTVRGKHIVNVDGKTTVFDTIRKALEFIFKERGLLK